jgi:hypothetical protein
VERVLSSGMSFWHVLKVFKAVHRGAAVYDHCGELAATILLRLIRVCSALRSRL